MLNRSELRRCAFFGGLTEDQIEKLLPFTETEKYEEGAELIAEGSPNDRIRFILEGRVAVVKGGVPLTEFTEGDVFGEMEVLEIMPSAASINALSRVTVMCISNKALHDIYKSDVNLFAMIIMNLARDLSRRLRRMDDMTVQKNQGRP